MGHALDLWPDQTKGYKIHMHRVHIRLHSVHLHVHRTPIPLEYLFICPTAVYLVQFFQLHFNLTVVFFANTIYNLQSRLEGFYYRNVSNKEF